LMNWSLGIGLLDGARSMGVMSGTAVGLLLSGGGGGVEVGRGYFGGKSK